MALSGLILFVVCNAVSFLTGRSIGIREYARNWYKVNMHNLLAIEGDHDSVPKEALRNLVKAQTYSTARYVPDSWLPLGNKFGPVDKQALGPVNAVKDPTNLSSDYENWLLRTQSEMRTR